MAAVPVRNSRRHQAVAARGHSSTTRAVPGSHAARATFDPDVANQSVAGLSRPSTSTLNRIAPSAGTSAPGSRTSAPSDPAARNDSVGPLDRNTRPRRMPSRIAASPGSVA